MKTACFHPLVMLETFILTKKLDSGLWGGRLYNELNHHAGFVYLVFMAETVNIKVNQGYQRAIKQSWKAG